MTKPIESLHFRLDIDAAGEALMGDPEKVKANLLDLIQRQVQEKLENFDFQDGDWCSVFDQNGNNVGDMNLNIELQDIIDDEDEWLEKCKEVVKETGITVLDGQVIYDFDTAAELDRDAVAEWFSNYTDSAITAEEVVPEASGWDWE